MDFFSVEKLGDGRWRLIAPGPNLDTEAFSAPDPEDGPVFDQRLRVALVSLKNRSFER